MRKTNNISQNYDMRSSMLKIYLSPSRVIEECFARATELKVLYINEVKFLKKQMRQEQPLRLKKNKTFKNYER